MVYAELASDQLAEEQAIKASLESRALTPLSIAGTALFANLAALAGALEVTRLEALGRTFLGVAVVLFLAAAYFAFQIIRPASHTHPSTTGVETLIVDDWLDDVDDAQRRVAHLNAVRLREIRERNAEKAENLHRALTSGFVAMLMFATAVVCAIAGQ